MAKRRSRAARRSRPVKRSKPAARRSAKRRGKAAAGDPTPIVIGFVLLLIAALAFASYSYP